MNRLWRMVHGLWWRSSEWSYCF